MAQIGTIFASPGVCVNGARNRVSLAAIRARAERLLASRRIGRNVVRISREFRTIIRQLTGPFLQTLNADKDSPNLANFRPLRRWGDGVRNRVFLHAITTWKDSLLWSRWITGSSGLPPPINDAPLQFLTHLYKYKQRLFFIFAILFFVSAKPLTL